MIYFSLWWKLTPGPPNNPGLFYNGINPVGIDTVPLPSSMHISESQQEFFRMLDEKIEKVRHSSSSIQCPSGVAQLHGEDSALPAAALCVLHDLEAKDFPSSSLVRYLNCKEDQEGEEFAGGTERILCFVGTSFMAG